MSSIAAQEVGKEVLETVRKGKRPILGKIIRKKGYALTTSTVPTQVTRTKSYKEVVKPVLERYLKEEQRLLEAVEKKNLKKEQYRILIDSLDKVRKQIQILSGGRTGNETIIFNWQK